MPLTRNKDIAALLARTRSIAVIGASANPARPSHEVMRFLQAQGYRTLPVNPGLAGQTLLGERVYARLQDIAEPVDMVDIFRRSSEVGPIVDDAIATGAKAVWMQLAVIDPVAAARAEAAGLAVVMDRCPLIEIKRLGMAGKPH